MNIDEVIDKIKKAVRLANRTTSEGERETALRLARNLAEKNGVAFEEVAAETRDGDLGKAIMDDDTRYVAKVNGYEMGLVCYILKQHFGVIVMINAPSGGNRYCRLTWFGSRLNIDVAKYVYHILLREGRRAWREASRLAKAIGADPSRKDFLRGFYWAVSRKLAERPLRNDLPDAIKAAEGKLLEYEQKNGEVQRKRHRDSKNLDCDALASGYAAGNSVSLSRPCGDNGERAAQIGHTAQLAYAK